jgi:hypothetical protein
MRNQMVYAENISSFKWTLKILGLWQATGQHLEKKVMSSNASSELRLSSCDIL